jgi:hypothetical protein
VIDDAEPDELGFQPLSAFPTVEMAPGVDVSFAIEVDVVYVTVDQAQLDRWEMTIEQVAPAAMANLRRTVGSATETVYRDAYDGIEICMVRGWPHWAASLLLLPDELKRLFGPHDQLFMAPYACNLMSLPIGVDRNAAADLVDLFGTINPRSLLLGTPAFAMCDGELLVEDLPGFEDLPDEEDRGILTYGEM